MFSTLGVSLSSAILYLSNASGFSRIYFSSEKKKRSLSGGISLPWLMSYTNRYIYMLLALTSSICEWRMVATALMMSSTLGFSRVEPMKIELIVDDFLSSIYYKIISLNNLYIIIICQLFQYFLEFLKFLSFLVS